MTAHRGRRAWHIDALNIIHAPGEKNKNLTLCGMKSPPMVKSYDSRLQVTCGACLQEAARSAGVGGSSGESASSSASTVDNPTSHARTSKGPATQQEFNP